MQKVFGILLFILIVGATVLLWYVLWQSDQPEPEPPTNNEDPSEQEPVGIDTSNWETYTNTSFGFELRYPPTWLVHEAPDDTITPKFNIYKPGSDETRLPFTHHSPDATHVSVYPEGIPTEGLSGETRTSTLNFNVPTESARDYLLENGTPYATFVNISTQNDAWKEAGFIFGGQPIANHTFECFKDGERISNDACDPLMGDEIIHSGSVNERDREIIEKILESFTIVETTDTPTTSTSTAAYKDLIRVDTPLPESTISSPLTIRGEARGQWYFEATFPVILTDWDGRIIAEGFAEAQDEWMTEQYVPFEAELTFTATTSVSDRGSLILQKANPSGLPENDDAFEYTVYFEENS